jgi:hypothetical protein
MNHLAEISDERSVKVFRVVEGKEIELDSGSTYVSGEVVLVRITDDSSGEFIFEASGGQFARGGCDGRRSTRGGKFRISAASGEDVLLRVGIGCFFLLVSKVFSDV